MTENDVLCNNCNGKGKTELEGVGALVCLCCLGTGFENRQQEGPVTLGGENCSMCGGLGEVEMTEIESIEPRVISEPYMAECPACKAVRLHVEKGGEVDG